MDLGFCAVFSDVTVQKAPKTGTESCRFSEC